LARINRSTAERATSMPSRRRWAHIANDPYSDSGLRFPFWSGWSWPVSTAVMMVPTGPFDGARAAQAEKILEAIWHPCPASARQVGATPEPSLILGDEQTDHRRHEDLDRRLQLGVPLPPVGC
jgi:hypothetical protein